MDSLGRELRAVVRPDVIRWSPVREQIGQQMEHIVGPEPPGHQDGQALAAVFVDDGKHPKRPAIMGPGLDEVIGPDVVRPTRAQTNAGPVVEPQTPPLGMLLGNLQPLAPPDALYALVIHDPAFGFEKGRDPPVTVAAILAGKAGRCPRSAPSHRPERQAGAVASTWAVPDTGRPGAPEDRTSAEHEPHTVGGARGLEVSLSGLLENQLLKR